MMRDAPPASHERILIVRQTQDLDAGKTQAAAMTAAPPARRMGVQSVQRQAGDGDRHGA